MNYPVDKTNKVVRNKQRGVYDKKTVYEIFDAGLVCQVAITLNNQPFIVPMAYARRDNHIILHGALNSRICKSLESGIPACVSVTHVDGLVLARSTFHHSMNYRSVVAFGTATLISDEVAKKQALVDLVEFLTPGRNSDCRETNQKELNTTSVIEFEIEQASVKIRSGGPVDVASDLDRDVWAGELTIKTQVDEWTPADDLKDGVQLPEYKKLLEKRVQSCN